MVNKLQDFIRSAGTGATNDVMVLDDGKLETVKQGKIDGRQVQQAKGPQIQVADRKAVQRFMNALRDEVGQANAIKIAKAIGITNSTVALTQGHVQAARIELVHLARKGQVDARAPNRRLDDQAFRRQLDPQGGDDRKRDMLIQLAALSPAEVKGIDAGLQATQGARQAAYRRLQAGAPPPGPITGPDRLDRARFDKELLGNFDRDLQPIANDIAGIAADPKKSSKALAMLDRWRRNIDRDLARVTSSNAHKDDVDYAKHRLDGVARTVRDIENDLRDAMKPQPAPPRNNPNMNTH